jgi:hypothetical protein
VFPTTLAADVGELAIDARAGAAVEIVAGAVVPAGVGTSVDGFVLVSVMVG